MERGMPTGSRDGHGGRWRWKRGSAPPRRGSSFAGRLLGIPIFLAVVAALALLALSPANETGASVPAAPSISITKGCSPETAVGGFIQYQFDITNDGPVAVNRTSVDDTVLGPITGLFPASLGPGDSATVFPVYQVQESDHPGPLVNVVTATYTSAAGDVAQATDTCSTVIPHMTITKTLAVNADSTFTFIITNDGPVPLRRAFVIDSELGNITSFFPVDLAVGQTVVVQITVKGQRICDNEVTVVYQSVPRAVTVTATAKCTPDGQLTFLEVVQIDTRTGLPFDEAGAPLTFFICQAVVALCDGGNADITTQDNPFGPVQVDPDTYTACVVEPAGFEVDAECKQATVPLGGSVTFTFFTSPIPDGDEGCTPGFWRNARNGRLLWDQATDAIPIAIGAALGIDPAVVAAIDSDSDFYLVFMVPAETAGLPADPFTTDDAIRIGGGQEKKLTRHGMAALLNAAAVNFPLGITEVKDLVQAALISGDFEPLATELDGFNNLSPDCPANNN